MSGEALTRVEAWQARARAARAGNDAAAAAAVIREAATVDLEALQPATRDLGRALASLAAEMSDLPEPSAIETLFNAALKVFERSSDTELSDLLTTWYNLVAIYDRHGAADHRNHVLGILIGVAERYDGSVDTSSAAVFIKLGELFREQRSVAAMRLMYRQVQRFMLAASDMSDETRAAWIARYVDGLEEASHAAEIEPALDDTLTALESQTTPQPHSVARCALLLAERRSARGDATGTADLLERLLARPDLLDADRTDALSAAGRTWYKAGEFDKASQFLMHAVRRRAGLLRSSS